MGCSLLCCSDDVDDDSASDDNKDEEEELDLVDNASLSGTFFGMVDDDNDSDVDDETLRPPLPF